MLAMLYEEVHSGGSNSCSDRYSEIAWVACDPPHVSIQRGSSPATGDGGATNYRAIHAFKTEYAIQPDLT